MWTVLALRARSPSTDVVLLEAASCGDGASARNGGFLHGYWSSLPRLRELLGADGALEVARSADGVVDAVRALGEDVGLVEGGMLLVSTSAAHDERLREAVQVVRELGVPEEAVELGREGLPFRSPIVRSAVRYREGATVQPARLVAALRRAVVGSGARLYEGTPVVELAPGLLRTPAGTVRAEEVVVATNAWAARLPEIARRVGVFRSAIVLTDPVDDLHDRLGWRAGEAAYDARAYLNYFRTTADGRVLMGSAAGVREAAERALRSFFPALADVPVARSWEGPIDVSSDRLPFFSTIPRTRVHVGAGYTGNGVGPSRLGGELLAALALGDAPTSPLVTRRPVLLPSEPIRSLGASLVRRALLSVDDAESAGRRPRRAATAVAALPARLGLPITSR